MPRLSGAERRRAILAALSRGNINQVAIEYGITRQSLHQIVRETEQKAEAEGEFWDEVREVIRERS